MQIVFMWQVFQPNILESNQHLSSNLNPSFMHSVGIAHEEVMPQ